MLNTKVKFWIVASVNALFGLMGIAWFVLPWLGILPAPFVPATVISEIAGVGADVTFGAVMLYGLVWLIPVIGLWNIASLFLHKSLPRFAEPNSAFLLIVNFFSSASLLFFVIAHLLAQSKNGAYFQVEDLGFYAMALTSLGFNAWCMFGIIGLFGRHDATWGEYQTFKTEIRAERGSTLARLTTWGIQRRLVVSFVAIIFLIITVLSWTLLNDFSSTILSNVRDGGMNLAERSASVIKTNITDSIAIDDYLLAESKKNQEAAYPFKFLESYQIAKNSDVHTIIHSTLEERVGTKTQADQEKPEAPKYLEHLAIREIEFLAPIKSSGKYIGYVSVVYDMDKILEPYFRTQIKVWVIAGIFVYLSLFVTYLFGRNIVIPILFLRMSVSSIAKNLEEMIKGVRRISTDTLQYKDRVGTRDEIKGLSMEIGNMTSVIKGVIPYISAATLMNAEKGITSEERELAFLFTDIRGFTSLCEGMKPAEVVTMLNQYLDLQTTIILKNHGDVDKFVGDEVMAMFEGPDREMNACRASIEIRAAMSVAQEEARAKHGKFVQIGVGINTGPVVFGSVGSRDRMDFTSIGDTVNLAARLEGANKNYGTKSLISESVYDKVKEVFLCREIDLITVVGKKKPVRIFEIIAEKSSATLEMKALVKTFEMGLKKYRDQDWDGAQSVLFPLWKETNDEAAAIFLKRIDLFRKSSPEADWDGVFALTVK